MQTHGISILGASGNAGAYLLHISLDAPVATTFGRLQRGHPFVLEAGHYLYAGSARGQRGPSALPCRLLRHASRTLGNPQHQIFGDLTAALITANFTGVHAPLSPKTLRWHIDYLLELPEADITAVYVLRDGAAHETTLVRWLASIPEVTTPIPGFGASDDPGASHLLQLPQEGLWWDEFLSRLQTWFANEVGLVAPAS